MNDQQIYMLMAKTPDIRAVQIADALDQELSDVSDALRPLVEVGDVVRHAGKSPNGQPAQMYNLSVAFKASKEYRALLSLVAAAPMTPIGMAAAMPASPTIPTFISPAAAMSFCERGVAYIQEVGAVSNADLATAMHLGKGKYPSAYLKLAIERGQVHYDGLLWRIGRAAKGAESASNAVQRGTPAVQAVAVKQVPVRQATPVQAVAPMAPVSMPAVVPVQAAAVALPEPVQMPEPEPVPGPVLVATSTFRCALWSDGVLELQRGGETVAKLAQAEGEQLVSFFGRMLANPLGVVQTYAPLEPLACA